MKTEKTISKVDVSIIQLRTAIELFNAKNFISAITLAAAAEEILGQLAKEKSLTNSLELESFMIQQTLSIKNYPFERNQIRNELKHRADGEHSIKYDNFRQTATTHIAGAITNYKLYRHELPKEKVIKDFCQTLGLS